MEAVLIRRSIRKKITIVLTVCVLMASCVREPLIENLYPTPDPGYTVSDDGRTYEVFNDNCALTACYWADNDQEHGIVCNQVSITGGTTKVDCTAVTWTDAVATMNAALQNVSSAWRYELGTEDLPVLKKS